jgi:hypothetical protein
VCENVIGFFFADYIKPKSYIKNKKHWRFSIAKKFYKKKEEEKSSDIFIHGSSSSR